MTRETSHYYRVPKWLFWAVVAVSNAVITVYRVSNSEWGWAALGAAATIAALYWTWEEK